MHHVFYLQSDNRDLARFQVNGDSVRFSHRKAPRWMGDREQITKHVRMDLSTARAKYKELRDSNWNERMTYDGNLLWHGSSVWQ